MDQIDGKLAQISELEQPLDRLTQLQSLESKDDPRIQSAIAWWNARYSFADKKQTRTMDKFIWVLLSLSSFVSNQGSNKKTVLAAYTKAFLSPETQQAMALNPRLYDEFLEACTLYIRTIDPQYKLFGFAMNKKLETGEIMVRIGKTVGEGLIPCAYILCQDQPYLDLVIRAIYEGAKAAYPHIQPLLMEHIERYEDIQCKNFVLEAVKPQGF